MLTDTPWNLCFRVPAYMQARASNSYYNYRDWLDYLLFTSPYYPVCT